MTKIMLSLIIIPTHQLPANDALLSTIYNLNVQCTVQVQGTSVGTDEVVIVQFVIAIDPSNSNSNREIVIELAIRVYGWLVEGRGRREIRRKHFKTSYFAIKNELF